MEKIDCRTLDFAVLEEKRITAVKLREAGNSLKSVAAFTGLGTTAISLAHQKFKKGGWKALILKPRGSKVGDHRNLTPAQEIEIQKKILDKRPEQLKLNFALWTRDAVRKLILQLYNFDMPIRTVGEYLKRWGYTPQKPAKVSYERRPEQVKKWLSEEFPVIKVRASLESADIYWGDETSLRAGDVRGKEFAPRGKTPVVTVTGRIHETLTMVSAITNKGKVSWLIFDGTINAERFIDFMTALIKDTNRKIFLILDNLKVHHSKPVKEWLETRKSKIELFFLPSYSPDLNPDEHLNSDMKQGIGSKSPTRTKKDLEETSRAHLQMLEKTPERIRKYFQDSKINYAA